MYCKYCGKEIDDRAAVCVHCGVPTDNYPYHQPQRQPQQAQQTNIIALIGFVLSFFMAIAGLVCSIIGYKEAPKYNGNGKSFAIAGIIISLAEIVITVLVVVLVLVALVFFDAAFVN